MDNIKAVAAQFRIEEAELVRTASHQNDLDEQDRLYDVAKVFHDKAAELEDAMDKIWYLLNECAIAAVERERRLLTRSFSSPVEASQLEKWLEAVDIVVNRLNSLKQEYTSPRKEGL